MIYSVTLNRIFSVFGLISVFYASLAVAGSSYGQESVASIQWPTQISDEMLLGKKLFFDQRLSAEETSSCAFCHQFDHGGSNPEPFATTAAGTLNQFNTPSVFNVRFNHPFGWTGKFRSLSDHLDKLIGEGVEMGITWPDLVARLQKIPEYQRLFMKIYGPDSSGKKIITKRHVIAALVAYEEALTTPSPFDKYLEGDSKAVGPEVIQGYYLFTDYGCSACHQGKNFGGNLFQKLGAIEPYFTDKNPPTGDDRGRFDHTGDSRDLHVFRVPSLRNIATTAPYLHNGSIADLETVIRLISWHQLGREMPAKDVSLIATFLGSLSGSPHPKLLP